MIMIYFFFATPRCSSSSQADTTTGCGSKIRIDHLWRQVDSAVRSKRRRRVTTVELPPGAVICFYTDGLVERRGVVLDVGLERLCRAVTAGPVESVLTDVMGQLIGDSPPDDDIAVLALRRQHSGKICVHNGLVTAKIPRLRPPGFGSGVDPAR
jgi:hypothetical protein